MLVESSLSSAGGVMHVYLTRMGVLSGAFEDRQLFPLIDRASGAIDGDG